MEDKPFKEVANSTVRKLLVEFTDKNEYQIKRHPKNENLLNVYSYRKGKNILGNISVISQGGFFIIEDKKDGKWKSYRTLGFNIQDEEFVNKIMNYIWS